jgi:hypothetical protein
MTYDLNTARRHRERRIAPGGLYRLEVCVHPGGFGPDGDLRLATNLSSLLLELELTIIEGEHEGTSFRHFMTVAIETGETASKKQLRSIEWSMQQLREILESHHGIAPDDEGEEARRLRKFTTFMSFDSLRFLGMVSVEKSDKFGEQNKLLRIIMPGDREWPAQQGPAATQATGSGAIALPPPREEFNDEIPF